MDRKQKYIIWKNEKFLRDNIRTSSLVPHLIQESILNQDDAERIDKEPTSDSKANKLLRIIETHPNGFESLITAFESEHFEFLAERLQKTVLNDIDKNQIKQDEEEYDKLVMDILKKEFSFVDDTNAFVMLDNIEEDIRFEFRKNGEIYNININHLRTLVSKSFPKSEPSKRKKTKIWIFKKMKRNHVVDEKNSSIEVPEFARDPSFPNKDEMDTDPGVHNREDVTASKQLPKKLDKLNEKELAEQIQPYLAEYEIPDSVVETIIEEEISGKVFLKSYPEYMKAMFPNLKRGKLTSLLCIRDDILKKDQELDELYKTDKNQESPGFQIGAENPNVIESASFGQYRERFRSFDKEATSSSTYRRGAKLISYNNRPGNLLDPVHVFSILDSAKDDLSYDKLGNEIIEFAAACLNDRTNGTIHIGVDPKKTGIQIEGEVRGIFVNEESCLRHLYRKLEERFYKEQLQIVLRCIRPPQFIDVVTKEKLPQKLKVMEVDVVPHSALVTDEAIFVRSTETQKPVLYRFTESGIFPNAICDEKTIAYMSKEKQLILETRKKQENNPKVQPIQSNMRQKIIDLLSAGEEIMSSAYYPLLFLSPLDSQVDNGIDRNNFEFLMDLDPNAIFDFDYPIETKGLYEFFDSDKEQVLKALTTDNFDQASQENQFKKESYSNLLDDIRMSMLKPWIFCNGYEALDKHPMSVIDWKQNRSRGFKEALRFYDKEIAEDRALILIFLLSKEYDILLEAVEEAIITFKDQWVVFAENEEIFSHFVDVLVNQRPTVNREQLRSRSVIGMPWMHVNQTIKELAGSKRTTRCEIPTSSGAFCHLKDKKRNELIDLEILSRLECEDPELLKDTTKLSQIKREEAEKFHKGEHVSWWNFYFQDHVLKRDVHLPLKTKVEDSLLGKKADEDNQIGVVSIIHQPGAGATTTAKHILWNLKSEYRCCIVKEITDQTAEQITILRNYEEPDNPKPPLVLIENADEEKVQDLLAVLQHRARITARRNSDMKVFCVLLLCIRRSTIHSVDDTSVALKHKLSEKELTWFKKRNHYLEKRFQNNEGTDPRFLISFNILKENFSTDYIHRTAVQLVKDVTDDKERRLLKYLSMLNTFDLEFQSVPVSAFDSLMSPKSSVTFTFGLVQQRQKRLNKSWEQTISQPLQVLVNRDTKAGLGSQLVGFSIVNPLFAAEIFGCFNREPETTSGIFMEFLESPIFNSYSMSASEVKKIIRTIMKKREEKEDTRGKVKFSPLIMKLLEDENEETAANVLLKSYEMTDDPMICQQLARLYIHGRNWKMAVSYAKTATDMKPQNSFLWDTYGQVYKNQLTDFQSSLLQENKKPSIDEIEKAIEIAKIGLQKFKREQEVSETDTFTRVNDAGYFGEIRMIILLLDILHISFSSKDSLHTCLTDRLGVPREMSNLKPESIEFLKSLENRSEITLKAIEDKTTQLKDDQFYTIFSHGFSVRKELGKLKENLDSYFGEESNVIPENFNDEEKADFRRRRVRRLGGRSLRNFIHQENVEDLAVMMGMLLENVNSKHCQPFDIITLLNVAVSMKVRKISQTKVTYMDMVQLVKRCYEKVVASAEKHYLEAYMYFVLLNWPTPSRVKQDLTSLQLSTTEKLHEVSKKWKDAFLSYHPRQKESRPVRRRETTNFFLGKGDDMNAIVHNEELLDPWGKKFVKGDKVWESADFVNKLLRLPGTLINDGNEILCNVDTRSGGSVAFHIPTSYPIARKSLWQKRVYFVLGFTWAGLKAYDVRQDPPCPNDSKPIPQNPEKGTETHQKARSKQVETMESFMRKKGELERKIEKLEKEKKRHGAGKEKFQSLEKEIQKINRELDKLYTERLSFYGT